MIEIVKEGSKAGFKRLGEMEPMEVGQVIDREMYHGDYVMRTHSTAHFEVINLSQRDGDSWTNKSCGLLVRPLAFGETLTIKLGNG